uniref:Auxin response factor n=1 Tax=Elaeis guineensis var. tenera TaxID=51953 RepID=A0A6I9RCN1_ELAGV|nr:auxin response factor 15 isoform X4 [Elaeis guineensis]XP_029121019.1 auxin response factor 15 isoform X3 [Elaeis guineensis]
MGIDLNTVEEEEEEEAELPLPAAAQVPRQEQHRASPPAAGAEALCLELWHACAGPLISLPRKGSVVVYLPQGHLEHLGDAAGGGGGCGGLFRYDLPPHVFCRVIDVKLHADAATDEVYAQLSLVAESEVVERQRREGEVEGDGEVEDVDGLHRSLMPHMFCKTLTASDTSTHGGFSVPRRAAEDCFPPLDYVQQRPSQELIAKDLHGVEWRFRHIYRGQPRRHLLTTGWSAFVNKKKLVSGDAVLFLRGNDGELRLGIRRAAQLKNGTPFSTPCSQSLDLGKLAAVANAVSTKSVFHIYYNPRASPSEFIVPYWKFAKSFSHSFSIGMRFKMRYESEDAAERRHTGLITGIGDLDPVRWPGSKWRCLLVRWDDDVDTGRQNRVSPWEIELTNSISGHNSLLAPGSKRTKLSLPMVDPDFPVPNGNGCPDFGEFARFHKVLQGQEFIGFRTPYDGIDESISQETEVRNHQYFDMRRSTTNANSCMSGGPSSGVRVPVGNSDLPYKCTGFSESSGFQRVLQGQELVPENPPYQGAIVNIHSRYGEFVSIDALRTSGAGNRCPAPSQGCTLLQPLRLPVQALSPSSVLMFQQASFKPPCSQSLYDMNQRSKDDGALSRKDTTSLYYRPRYVEGEVINEHHKVGVHSSVHASKPELRNDKKISSSACKLFGFPLTQRIPLTNEVDRIERNFETNFPTSKSQIPAKPLGRSCTTVHKQGSVVVRVVDLSKLDGYDELICELEQLFDMKGLLNDPHRKWNVVYTDDEDDMMLVGDDPWQEFCKIASKILICTNYEEMLACGDEARGCSDQPSFPFNITRFSLGSSKSSSLST